MPIIKLPDAMRDVITSALGNDLSRRIGRGQAVAVLTYQCSETGDHQYLVEFKRAENAKTLASFQGHSSGPDGTEPVPLSPKLDDGAEALAQGIDTGDGGFVLRHIQSAGAEPHDFRVEWTPPESSAVHLALEAKARAGESVPMERADLYPYKG